MLVLETQVFQLSFDSVESQTIRQRSVDVLRFSCNFKLFCGRHRTQSSHVMQPICNLYQDNANIFRHRQQKLSEIFCLRRCLFPKNTARNLRQTIYYLSDLLSEQIFYIFNCILGVFNYIMQQSRTDGGRS